MTEKSNSIPSVDEALVLKCIELALRAPTGSNGQNWEFVVKDRDVKEKLGKRYRQAWSLYGGIGRRDWRGRYGPTIRKPVEEVAHVDGYGNSAWLDNAP
jgi:nitroreductase